MRGEGDDETDRQTRTDCDLCLCRRRSEVIERVVLLLVSRANLLVAETANSDTKVVRRAGDEVMVSSSAAQKLLLRLVSL